MLAQAYQDTIREAHRKWSRVSADSKLSVHFHEIVWVGTWFNKYIIKYAKRVFVLKRYQQCCIPTLRDIHLTTPPPSRNGVYVWERERERDTLRWERESYKERERDQRGGTRESECEREKGGGRVCATNLRIILIHFCASVTFFAPKKRSKYSQSTNMSIFLSDSLQFLSQLQFYHQVFSFFRILIVEENHGVQYSTTTSGAWIISRLNKENFEIKLWTKKVTTDFEEIVLAFGIV